MNPDSVPPFESEAGFFLVHLRDYVHEADFLGDGFWKVTGSSFLVQYRTASSQIVTPLTKKLFNLINILFFGLRMENYATL